MHVSQLKQGKQATQDTHEANCSKTNMPLAKHSSPTSMHRGRTTLTHATISQERFQIVQAPVDQVPPSISANTFERTLLQRNHHVLGRTDVFVRSRIITRQRPTKSRLSRGTPRLARTETSQFLSECSVQKESTSASTMRNLSESFHPWPSQNGRLRHRNRRFDPARVCA